LEVSRGLLGKRLLLLLLLFTDEPAPGADMADLRAHGAAVPATAPIGACDVAQGAFDVGICICFG